MGRAIRVCVTYAKLQDSIGRQGCWCCSHEPLTCQKVGRAKKGRASIALHECVAQGCSRLSAPPWVYCVDVLCLSCPNFSHFVGQQVLACLRGHLQISHAGVLNVSPVWSCYDELPKPLACSALRSARSSCSVWEFCHVVRNLGSCPVATSSGLRNSHQYRQISTACQTLCVKQGEAC